MKISGEPNYLYRYKLKVQLKNLGLSYELGMRKPDPEIFERVLKENSLKKNETLFIDDSLQHIESANKIGIQTLFLKKGKTITELFPDFLA